MRFGPLPPSFTNTYSLAFDGVDDYVDCGDSDTFSFGNGSTDSPFTLSAWVKLDSLSSNTTIVSKDLGGFGVTREYTLFVLSTGKLRIFLKNQGGNNQQSIDSTTVLLTGQWYHIGCTYNGVGGNNAADGLTLYVNGSAESPTNVIKNGYIAMSNTIAPFRIGKYASSNLMAGSVDEVAVFSSELTSGNIASIYNSGVPNDLTSLNPVAWYRMGDNGTFKSPQWLIPNNENKTKFSNYSFEYDGVDDYVDLGTSVNLGTVSTISLWIKHDGGGTTSQTIIGENSYSFDYLLSINWSLPRVYVRFNAGYYSWDGTPIDDTDWHNIIIVRDTTTTAKIYFDGVDQGAPDLSGGTFSGNTLFRYLGNNYPSNTQYFSGNIDEVACFNTSLTLSEITTLYNSGVPTDISSLSPVGYWRSENSTFLTNWTVTDNGSGGNDGTSANMTIEDRVGDAPNSTSNALSYNMDEADRETDVPS